MRPPKERGLEDDTIRRIEQAISGLATQSVARMDEKLPWFRELPADQRSWVTLVAQAGLQSYVGWLRQPDDVLRLTGEVFAAAPRAMARSVTLQQTVDLVQQAIFVAEEHLPSIVRDEDVDVVREELVRFSREVAFSAARVYAMAAESRGAWDERLEALVIDRLVTGVAVGDPLPSQLAALGWNAAGPIAAVVGSPPEGDPDDALHAAQIAVRGLGLDAMVGVHGERLVVVFGGAVEPATIATKLLHVFGPGSVVVSPAADDLRDAARVTQAALSALRAVPAWPGAPRLLPANALLPERAILGDDDAREQLIQNVYLPLLQAGDVLLQTVTTFLDHGGALESTARSLFVHANTVRARLRRVAETCGEVPTDGRGAFALRVAIVLGSAAQQPPTATRR